MLEKLYEQVTEEKLTEIERVMISEDGVEIYNGPRVKTSNEDLMVNVWL